MLGLCRVPAQGGHRVRRAAAPHRRVDGLDGRRARRDGRGRRRGNRRRAGGRDQVPKTSPGGPATGYRPSRHPRCPCKMCRPPPEASPGRLSLWPSRVRRGERQDHPGASARPCWMALPTEPAPAAAPEAVAAPFAPPPDSPFDFDNQPTRAYTLPPSNGAFATGTEDFNPDATRVQVVPDELLRASARPSKPEMPAAVVSKPPPATLHHPAHVGNAAAPVSDEQHFQDVYREFLATQGEVRGGSGWSSRSKSLPASSARTASSSSRKYSCRTGAVSGVREGRQSGPQGHPGEGLKRGQDVRRLRHGVLGALLCASWERVRARALVGQSRRPRADGICLVADDRRAVRGPHHRRWLRPAERAPPAARRPARSGSTAAHRGRHSRGGRAPSCSSWRGARSPRTFRPLPAPLDEEPGLLVSPLHVVQRQAGLRHGALRGAGPGSRKDVPVWCSEYGEAPYEVSIRATVGAFREAAQRGGLVGTSYWAWKHALPRTSPGPSPGSTSAEWKKLIAWITGGGSAPLGRGARRNAFVRRGRAAPARHRGHPDGGHSQVGTARRGRVEREGSSTAWAAPWPTAPAARCRSTA